MDIDYLFKNIDQDKDGVIDFEELKVFIKKQKLPVDEFSNLEDLYKEIDKSGDQKVSPNELKDFLMTQLEKNDVDNNEAK